jgi:RimJ/RimL family protein N-acetyltransferase
MALYLLRSNFGLEKIELDVLEFNTPAIKIYNRLGFVAEPSFMWHYDEFGMYWHVIKMSISKSNFLLGKRLHTAAFEHHKKNELVS